LDSFGLIWAFQWVTANPNEKILPGLNSRSRLCVSALNAFPLVFSSHDPPRRAPRSRAAISDNLDKYHDFPFKQRDCLKRFAHLVQTGPSAARLSVRGFIVAAMAPRARPVFAKCLDHLPLRPERMAHPLRGRSIANVARFPIASAFRRVHLERIRL
jgi:hypothetical protein